MCTSGERILHKNRIVMIQWRTKNTFITINRNTKKSVTEFVSISDALKI